MSALLSPTPVFKAFDNNGAPLAFGLLTSFAAGTTTNQPTYVDSTLTTQNTNPIVLNSRGECNLWLDPSLSYKFQLQDSFGNSIWTVDNVLGSSAILFPDGTVSIPSIVYAAEPTTGFYRAGPGSIGTAIAGSQASLISAGVGANTVYRISAIAGQTAFFEALANGLAPGQGFQFIQTSAGTGQIAVSGTVVATVNPSTKAWNFITPTLSVNGTNITPSSGTFTVGITGLTTSPTGTATWQLVNGYVDLYIPGAALGGTSNATTCTLTGLPANLQPPTAGYNFPIFVVDAGTGSIGCINISNSGTMSLTKGTNPTASSTFTASGTKSIFTISVRYLLI